MLVEPGVVQIVVEECVYVVEALSVCVPGSAVVVVVVIVGLVGVILV